MPSRRSRPSRPRRPRPDVTDAQIQEAIQFIQQAPDGVSRRDLLAVLRVGSQRWLPLREALVQTGEIQIRGRGPGMRLLHRSRLSLRSVPPQVDLHAARATLQQLLQRSASIDSRIAQEATGLNATAVRKLLQPWIQDGTVEQEGRKGGTRYRWASDRAREAS